MTSITLLSVGNDIVLDASCELPCSRRYLILMSASLSETWKAPRRLLMTRLRPELSGVNTLWHAVRHRLQKDCQDFGSNCTFLDWNAPNTTGDELGALTFATMAKAW